MEKVVFAAVVLVVGIPVLTLGFSTFRIIGPDNQRDLTIWPARYGVEPTRAALANIHFDPAYEKAIEATQIEEQTEGQERSELIQARRHAEIVAAEAKGKGVGREATPMRRRLASGGVDQ